MSKLWLRKEPNVSQSDLKREQEEKAARTTPDIKSTLDSESTADTKEPLPATQSTVDISSTPDIKSTHDTASILPGQWTATPNGISDHLNRTLELSDQSVLSRLYRLTWGFHRDTCTVSNATLGDACNISSKQVQRSAHRLQQRGLIEVLGYDFDNPDKKKRGVIYRMLLPKATVDIKSGVDFKSKMETGSRVDIKSPIKDKAFKENSKKGINRLSPEEIQSFAATVADLLGEGQPIEEIEAKFAPTMHPVDWANVRSTALASPRG